MNSRSISTPVLAAAFALCLIAQPLLAGTFGDFTYEDHGTSITITHFSQSASGAVAIPSTIIGKPVTTIGDSAFWTCEGLTSVTIPNSVASIGEYAFSKCTGLTSVSIGSGVTSIGEFAFYYCESLTSVAIPNSVTTIGESAFGGCSGLTSVSIGSGVTSIGVDVFNYCTGLTSVTIPNSVTSIGDDAFSFSGLTSVTIPNSVTSIGKYAFSHCYRLTSVSIGSGVTSIGDFAFYYCDGLTSVGIGPGVTSIGVAAFDHCSGLTSVAIPNSVTSIGEYAFQYCDGLTSVSIGSGVTSIGDCAFQYCFGLTRAKFFGNAPAMNAGAFYSAASDFMVYYINGKTGFTSPTWLGSPCVGMDATPEITVQQPAGTHIADGGTKVLGNTTVGASRSLVFTIKNTGILNLAGLAITENGANAGDFIVTAPAKTTLAPFGSTTFTVTFAPGSVGAKTAAIHIKSNDADENSFDINLTGTGIAPEIAVEQPSRTNLTDGVSSKSFDLVAVGKTLSKTFTIRNTGTAALTNLAITKNGTHARDFIVTAPVKTRLAPGTSTTFKVTFKPTAKGTRNAAIHIRSNDANENPFDIKLSGTGLVPASKASLKQSFVAAAGWGPGQDAPVRTFTSTVRIAGEKFNTLTIRRRADGWPPPAAVEVSTNLMDWFSGPRHTTVMEDLPHRLRVRDNTPLAPNRKRFIRVREK